MGQKGFRTNFIIVGQLGKEGSRTYLNWET